MFWSTSIYKNFVQLCMFSEKYYHDDFPHKISLESNYTFRVFFWFFCFVFVFCFVWSLRGEGHSKQGASGSHHLQEQQFLAKQKIYPRQKKNPQKKEMEKNPQKKTMRLKLLLSNNFYVVILPSYRGMQFFYSHWLIFTSDCFKPCLVEMALEMTLKSYHRLALSLPLTPFEAQLRVPFNLGNLNSMPFKMLWAIFD